MPPSWVRPLPTTPLFARVTGPMGSSFVSPGFTVRTRTTATEWLVQSTRQPDAGGRHPPGAYQLHPLPERPSAQTLRRPAPPGRTNQVYLGMWPSPMPRTEGACLRRSPFRPGSRRPGRGPGGALPGLAGGVGDRLRDYASLGPPASRGGLHPPAPSGLEPLPPRCQSFPSGSAAHDLGMAMDLRLDREGDDPAGIGVQPEGFTGRNASYYFSYYADATTGMLPGGGAELPGHRVLLDWTGSGALCPEPRSGGWDCFAPPVETKERGLMLLPDPRPARTAPTPSPKRYPGGRRDAGGTRLLQSPGTGRWRCWTGWGQPGGRHPLPLPRGGSGFPEQELGYSRSSP